MPHRIMTESSESSRDVFWREPEVEVLDAQLTIQLVYETLELVCVQPGSVLHDSRAMSFRYSEACKGRNDFITRTCTMTQ